RCTGACTGALDSQIEKYMCGWRIRPSLEPFSQRLQSGTSVAQLYWVLDAVLSSKRSRTHFFFSSRRRHTRFSRDWSSDVCSSDLFDFKIIADIRNQIGRYDGFDGIILFL